MITQHHHSETFQLHLFTFQHINFILLMKDIKNSFQNLKAKLNLLNSSYKVPKQYIDCYKLVQKRIYGPTGLQSKKLTTKQKQKKFHKKFYLDETQGSFKDSPSPNKYNETFSSMKRYKSVSTFITNLKPNEKDLGKRPTWIQDIQKYEQKYQEPSVGKYNLLTKSDFLIKKKSNSMQQLLKNGKKFNNLDDVVFVSAQIPGPGTHNSHKQVPKLKVNMMNSNTWKKKHQTDQKKLNKKLNSSNISSCSYSPVKDKTFDSFSKNPKKSATLMRLSSIQKKKGRTSQFLSPGPGAHQTINKWGRQTFQRENLVGKLNIFAKTTRSFPTLRVYH